MSSKILVLTCALLALTALSAPAAQAELFWWEDDGEEEVFLEAPKPAEPRVSLTFTMSPGLTIGPCTTAKEAPWAGILFNAVEETGEGKFYEGAFGSPCPTNLPGCTITATPEFNWLLMLKSVEGTPFVDITEVGVKFVSGGGCGAFGVPPEINAAGTLTGEFDNSDSRIVFSKEGDLIAGGKEIAVDGEIRFGTHMTAK